MNGSAAAATNCNSFPNNLVTGNVNDDVFADGYTGTIAASAFVNGNVLQVGEGNLVIHGDGTFKGNSEHELPGSCVNSIADFKGAVCNRL